jgi:hypothetical protein
MLQIIVMWLDQATGYVYDDEYIESEAREFLANLRMGIDYGDHRSS